MIDKRWSMSFDRAGLAPHAARARTWSAVLVITFAMSCGTSTMEEDEPQAEEEVSSRESAIVNGTTVAATTLRNFTNAIVKLDTSNGSCSGLLIAPRLVLTAGHCSGNCSWDTPVNATVATARIGADSKNPLESVPVVSQWDITGDPDSSWAHDAGWPVDNLVGVSCSLFGHADLGLWELAYPPRQALPYWDEAKVQAAFGKIGKGDAGSLYGFGPSGNGLLQRGTGGISKAPFWDTNTATAKHGVRTEMTLSTGTQEGGDSGGPIFDAAGVPIAATANSNGQWISGPAVGAHLGWIEAMAARLGDTNLPGDFDGDGRTDVLHSNAANEGDWADLYVGRARPASPVVPSQIMTWCSGKLVSGDVNGDGKDDLLCAKTMAGVDGAPSAEVAVIYLAKTSAAGAFTGFETNGLVVALPERCGQPLLGHFDGVSTDGKRRADLLCRTSLSVLSSKLTLYRNTGNLSQPFSSASRWWSTDGWCRSSKLHVLDLDGDSRDDLLCDRSAAGALEVRFSSTAALGLEAARSVATSWCKSGKLLSGHLDADSAADLLCWRSGHGPTYRLSNKSRSSVPFSLSGITAFTFDDSGFCSKPTEEVRLLDLSATNRRHSLVCYNHENGQTTIAAGTYNATTKAVSFALKSPTRTPTLIEKL